MRSIAQVTQTTVREVWTGCRRCHWVWCWLHGIQFHRTARHRDTSELSLTETHTASDQGSPYTLPTQWSIQLVSQIISRNIIQFEWNFQITYTRCLRSPTITSQMYTFYIFPNILYITYSTFSFFHLTLMRPCNPHEASTVCQCLYYHFNCHAIENLQPKMPIWVLHIPPTALWEILQC